MHCKGNQDSDYHESCLHKPSISLNETFRNIRKRFVYKMPPFHPSLCKQSKQRPSAFENQTKMADIASTHRLPSEFLDYYPGTGINESIKTSQSIHLNISVSFNKHIRNVFNCKHLDGSSWNIESCCLLCLPY